MEIHVDKEKAIEEAVNRMEELGIAPSVIKNFQKDKAVTVGIEDGTYFLLDATDRERIQDLEERGGFLIYMVIRSKMSYGKMTNYIAVSACEAEWDIEHMLIKKCALMAFIYDHDAPHDSRLGIVHMRRLPNSTLERIW